MSKKPLPFDLGDELQEILFDHAMPIRVGEKGCEKIVVGQLNGPMGHYAVAFVTFSGELRTVVPLHNAVSATRPSAIYDEFSFTQGIEFIREDH